MYNKYDTIDNTDFAKISLILTKQDINGCWECWQTDMMRLSGEEPKEASVPFRLVRAGAPDLFNHPSICRTWFHLPMSKKNIFFFFSQESFDHPSTPLLTCVISTITSCVIPSHLNLFLPYFFFSYSLRKLINAILKNWTRGWTD